jgi:ubiquinone/menaquinone biosynthesis C-methylase UbiE
MDKNALAINTYNQIARIYSDKYFDDASDTLYISKFLKLLPPGSKILDIGSGPGQFAKFMSEGGYLVEGIDLSPQMVEVARAKVPNIKFELMDMRKLTFPNNSFDGLLVSYSLIHIPEEEVEATIQGFYRVLKPAGKLMLITQKGEPDKVVAEPLKYGEQMFVNFFQKEKLANLLIKNHFSVISQEETATNDPNALSDKVIYTLARK